MKNRSERILFSHSYFYRFDSKQWRFRQPYPPLMTITAAAYLRENGYEVGLFDACLAHSAQEIILHLENFRPDVLVIYDDGFNYLTKMCLTTMRDAAFEMQQLAKARGIRVITCSSDSSDHYEKYLQNGADFVIRGEGEMSLLKLMSSLSAGEEEQARLTPGVCYLDGSEVKINAKAEVLRELDLLPMAAWDLVDLESYRETWRSIYPHHYINLATTRGCPYKCNWCAKPIYGNRYHSRSPAVVVDEIEFHVRQHGINHFWMCDDIFGLKPGWVQAFRNELKKRDLTIRYKIQSRADLLLHEDNIQALVESGLDEAWIGAESGSQKVLNAMDKGTTIEQICEATRLLKSKKVKVAFFIQYGYLGETWSDIRKTIQLIKKLMPDSLGISVSYPLPGTGFYDRVKPDLRKKANWTDSDDLDMMFSNTYPPAFYRTLHKYTHHVYQLNRTIILIKEWSRSSLRGQIRSKWFAKIPYLMILIFLRRSVLVLLSLKRQTQTT